MHKSRLHSLDYLRGLAALGIMVYHYLTWSLGRFQAETFLGKVGIYGVSLFYVLSGLTLFHVYYDRMRPSLTDLRDFYIKRFFRIYPLLWLATTAAILLSGTLPGWKILLLNYTGLFGFFKWDLSLSAGIWSIGNELVFYVFFPVFVLFARNSRAALLLLAIVLLAFMSWFAFVVIDPSHDLHSQWHNYVNPLNQVFLFMGGFLIGFLSRARNFPKGVLRVLLLGALAGFIFFPVQGDGVQIVSGFNRIWFVLFCLIICFAVYKDTFVLPAIIDRPLALLGEASYSVYLLHPIVFTIVTDVSARYLHWRVALLLPVSFLLTLGLSYLVFRRFERPLMDLGKRVAGR